MENYKLINDVDSIGKRLLAVEDEILKLREELNEFGNWLDKLIEMNENVGQQHNERKGENNA